MTSALLLAAALLGTALPQETDRVDRIVALARSDSPTLTTQVHEYPDAARRAFAELLRRSVGEEAALDAADVLAGAYFEAWTDPYYLQDAGRFRSWPAESRRARLGADSLRLAGNETFSESGPEQPRSCGSAA